MAAFSWLSSLSSSMTIEKKKDRETRWYKLSNNKTEYIYKHKIRIIEVYLLSGHFWEKLLAFFVEYPFDISFSFYTSPSYEDRW